MSKESIESSFLKLPDTILNDSDIRAYYVNNFGILPEFTKNDLLEKSKILISQSFGQPQENPNFDQDVMDFLRNGELFIITHNVDVVGIRLVRGWSFKDLHILYLSGSAISPSWQGKGLNSRLTAWITNSRDIDIIAGRTQNPNMYRLVQKLSRNVWPQLGSPVPDFVQEIGLDVARRVGRTTINFNSNNLVDIGTYGSTLYDTIPHPQSRHQEVNYLFSTFLNFGRGDSLFVIGEVTELPN